MPRATLPGLTQSVGIAVAVGAAMSVGCGDDATTGTSEPLDASTNATDASTDPLTDLFQDGSPEDIASELENMVDSGDADAAPVPLYKGVSFV